MNDFERYLRAIPGTQPVIEQIGIMTILWNRIELLWYLIYTCLLHEAPREKIDRVFQQFITGSSQRQFIAALADTAFPDKPRYMRSLKKKIGQLLAKSNDLSGDRNAFIHGDYVGSLSGISISPGGDKNKKPNKMAGKKITAELKRTIDEMSAFADDLDEFRIILIQEFLPPEKRSRPYSQEKLDSLPAEFRSALPRDLLERVAPPNLRAKD